MDDMWVQITEDHDHRVSTTTTVAYKKGMKLRVPRAHAEAAIKAGKATAVETPANRDDAKK